MRTEDLLKQSQSLAQQLQTRQEELQQTNEELQEKARLLAAAESGSRTQEHGSRAGPAGARRKGEAARAHLEIQVRVPREHVARIADAAQQPADPFRSVVENPDGNLTQKQIEFAKTIHSSGNDLLMLINDILDLRRSSRERSLSTSAICASTISSDYVERTFRHVAEHEEPRVRDRLDRDCRDRCSPTPSDCSRSSRTCCPMRSNSRTRRRQVDIDRRAGQRLESAITRISTAPRRSLRSQSPIPASALRATSSRSSSKRSSRRTARPAASTAAPVSASDQPRTVAPPGRRDSARREPGAGQHVHLVPAARRIPHALRESRRRRHRHRSRRHREGKAWRARPPTTWMPMDMYLRFRSANRRSQACSSMKSGDDRDDIRPAIGAAHRRERHRLRQVSAGYSPGNGIQGSGDLARSSGARASRVNTSRPPLRWTFFDRYRRLARAGAPEKRHTRTAHSNLRNFNGRGARAGVKLWCPAVHCQADSEQGSAR